MSVFMWFERNPDKGHRDMSRNQTFFTIMRSIFINKKLLVITPARQTT